MIFEGECGTIATIKDVARLAQVSVSTASYALKGDPRVVEKTRLAVQEAAKTLGYYPTSAARALKTKRSGIIGAFIRGYAGPVFSGLLSGIHTTLLEHGYDMISASNQTTVERFLRERTVDGAIVLDSYMEDYVIRETASERLPIILLDRNIEDKYVHSSLLDNEKLFSQIVEILVTKGCRNIIYMSGAENSFDSNHRYLGYLRTVRRHDLPEIVYRAHFTIQSGDACMERILDDGMPFDAVACGNDEMAIGAMEAMKRRGIKIPTDKMVTGFDDIDLAKYYQPSLTTVSIDRESWGATVALQMIRAVNGEPMTEPIHISGEVVQRESTGVENPFS